MLLIFAIFRRKSYLLIALYVFVFELFILLPAYFAIKLSLEGDTEISSPLLSFVHRLIVNPMLMLVLMAGFFYQRRTRL
jgi:exosortase F-associated protein